MFGVVSRLRQVRSKALPCILSYTILKAGAFILAQRSMEITLNRGSLAAIVIKIIAILNLN